MLNKTINLEQPRRGKTHEVQVTPHQRSAVWGKRLCVLALFLWCLCISGGAYAQVFVSAAAADDSGDGLTWGTAKRTLAGALAVAIGETQVCVKVGYYEVPAELMIPAGVTVTGGYASASTGTDTTQRMYPGANSQWTDPTHCTILDGGMSHRVATVSTGGTLEGCVIQHGNTSGNGGGVLVDGGTLSHCVVTHCMAHSGVDGVQAKGGGVYIQNHGSMLNCVVCYNRANNGYGAAAVSGDVVNNTITQNYGMDCGTVTDYDNNTYTTVVIGEQCWMRENLRTTHFADGTVIPHDQSSSYSEPCYYNVGTSSSETEVYGLLYNITAARHGLQTNYSDQVPSGMQGVCPNGWHLPSSAEFAQMAAWLYADDAFGCGQEATYIAKALASQQYWLTSNVSCAVGNESSTNNLSLFDARPAGYYDGSFSAFYAQCRFWTTSRNGSNNDDCVYWGLAYDNALLSNNYTTSEKGYSVRCVKN